MWVVELVLVERDTLLLTCDVRSVNLMDTS